ncbi:hypothetical protein EC973_001889 [Apophysomyces ossiformis]|uniref:Uncharacterized protein n=1 Tax=Apophysomyces ossiformis TaxID=679940 RepID=A0A8H7EMW3_9FUNG|nr:hypothetical protein EC973_001889 [Apophysomyces ossiformis]
MSYQSIGGEAILQPGNDASEQALARTREKGVEQAIVRALDGQATPEQKNYAIELFMNVVERSANNGERLGGLEKRLKQADQQVEKNEEKIRILERLKQEGERVILDLRRRIQASEITIEQLRNNQNKETANHKETVKKLQHMLQKSQEQIEDLLKERQRENNDHQEGENSFQKQLEENFKRIAELELQRTELQTQVGAKTDRIQSLQNTVGHYCEIINSLQGKRRTYGNTPSDEWPLMEDCPFCAQESQSKLSVTKRIITRILFTVSIFGLGYGARTLQPMSHK